MKRSLSIALVLCLFLPLSAVAQTSPAPHFVPRYTFAGSDLRDWEPVGDADWEADSGFIMGSADDGPGMLVFDRAYQDVAFFTRFRCASACEAGLLFRLEETSNGQSGLFVDLGDDHPAVYRVTVSDDGVVTARTSASEEPGDEAPGFEAGSWNDLTVYVEANYVHRAIGREWDERPRGIAQNVEPITDSDPVHYAPEVRFGYGPIALYVESGTIEFVDVSASNLLRQDIQPEMSSERFEVQQLNEFYHAWGADAGDLNADGILDLVAGPYYYLGPDYGRRHEIYRSRTYHAGEEYVPDMVSFSGDFNGDGWDDVLATESRALVFYVNPRGEHRHWTRHMALPDICSEIVIKHDIDNDGEFEYVYAGNDRRLAYGEPDPANPTDIWDTHAISDPIGGNCRAHGLGVGDVNGDGRADVLNQYGWWEQPASGPDNGPWIHHDDTSFLQGGAISVNDFNGDGLNDVIGSDYAHSWGLYWWEQTRSDDGEIGFIRHTIFDNLSTRNAGDVAFSQVHSGALIADMDGDGTNDFVTGKRHWSHMNQYLDADHDGEAVVYWYRTIHDPEAPGGVRFEPELIHNKSGVGSEFKLVDMDDDGRMDVIASGTRGTFILWNRLK